MFRLERAIRREREIIGLLLVKRCELHADLGEVKGRNLLVKMLRQRVNLAVILALLRPEFDLRKRLVCE